MDVNYKLLFHLYTIQEQTKIIYGDASCDSCYFLGGVYCLWRDGVYWLGRYIRECSWVLSMLYMFILGDVCVRKISLSGTLKIQCDTKIHPTEWLQSKRLTVPSVGKDEK